MLTKDLLCVSRSGGGYHPAFVDETDTPLAAAAIERFQAHVDESRAQLRDALTDLEGESEDFKLVRGLAKLLEREGAFETRAPLSPVATRRVTFAAADDVCVVSEAERAAALREASDRLGGGSEAVERSLYADRDCRQILTSFEPRWGPDGLLDQYNLSLAQTALFDATEVRVRSSDPRALISAVKRLRLLYEIRTADDGGREVLVTGPDALFRTSRRYGTRFARLLRTVVAADEWQIEATVDDRGTERTMRLSDEGPIVVPAAEPIAEVSYDSDVERDFAVRFEALDLDWTLVREPEALEAGARVMIPDFAFEYEYADFRVFFEIMGFWTPEYVEKKLDQLDTLEDVEMLVAVDETLGVGEEIEALEHRAIPYSGTVRVKDVRNALRQYEDGLVEDSAEAIPDELRPDEDVVALEQVASEHGVSVGAVEDAVFPEHDLVGRTLVRPAVLEELASDLEAGMSLDHAEEVLESRGISERSAPLSRLGYRVEWDGLSGGVLRSTD